MTYTLAKIAKHNKEAGYYYFSPSTLRFFGQRRTDFSVLNHNNRAFVFARMNDITGSKKSNFWSIAEYNPKTGSIDSVGGSSTNFYDKSDVRTYLRTRCALGR